LEREDHKALGQIERLSTAAKPMPGDSGNFSVRRSSHLFSWSSGFSLRRLTFMVAFC
jgi:hypothetical protein